MAALTGSGFVTAPPGVDAMDAELPPSSQSTLLLQKKKDMAEVRAHVQWLIRVLGWAIRRVRARARRRG
jgi:hypothetical protein